MQDFNDRRVSLIQNIPPFLYAVIVLIIIFFLYQVIGAGLAVLAAGGGIDYDIGMFRIVLSFSQFMFILAPTILFARLQTPDLKNTFRLNSPRPLIFFLAVVGILLVQPLLQGYMYFQDIIIDNLPFMKESLQKLKEFFDYFETETLKIVRAYSVPEFLSVIFIIAVTPAICEELLFRGFVLSNIRKAAKPAAAIILSGFMFAVYHFQPFEIIPLFILGFYLGFVVYYSNSIFTGMVCHFLNNFLSAYLVYVYGREEFETPKFSASEKINYALITIVTLILFVMLLVYIYRISLKNKELIIDN